MPPRHLLTLPLLSVSALLAACDSQPAQTSQSAAPAESTAGPTASTALTASEAQATTGSVAASPVAAASVALPAPGEVVRLSGDSSITVTSFEKRGVTLYRSGKHLVDTALPVGYPRPTPPGTIELKSYPSIRRAEFGARVKEDGSVAAAEGVKAEGSGMQNRGRDGFWPLFRHIQRRDIAMTAPVEMDWRGASVQESEAMRDAQWTMSFLYREVKQGADGADPKDERVLVVDTKPMLVLSAGLAGKANDRTINKGIAVLREFLANNPQYQPAGDLRGLFYNDPTYSEQRAWAEIQVPVTVQQP
jgi:hypothetical protein